MKAFLILEDGTVFEGTSIGSAREVISVIVFNPSMIGYLEVLVSYTHLDVYKRQVIITLVLAFVFLHEEFTAKSLIGCVLIGVGTLVMVL